jgi:hypothetical protein
MKYETPQLTALTPAIDAIQTDVEGAPKTGGLYFLDNVNYQEHIGAYMDWED